MTISRRRFLSLLGALPMLEPLMTDVVVQPTVRPRHVLCFLGGDAVAYAQLTAALSAAIAAHAPGFEIDRAYSAVEPYPRMEESFAVCWDRVAPRAWTPADEQAVAKHRSVRYVLGPPMTADTAVATSAAALLLIRAGIEAGAVAVKGESAGVAHGLSRWKKLIDLASTASRDGDVHALRRACRLALAKRPLSSGEYLESVGFHLVGLPEVYISNDFDTEREAVGVMDAVADELSRDGVEAVLQKYEARLTHESTYASDDFKYNPYGCVIVDR